MLRLRLLLLHFELQVLLMFQLLLRHHLRLLVHNLDLPMDHHLFLVLDLLVVDYLFPPS